MIRHSVNNVIVRISLFFLRFLAPGFNVALALDKTHTHSQHSHSRTIIPRTRRKNSKSIKIIIRTSSLVTPPVSWAGARKWQIIFPSLIINCLCGQRTFPVAPDNTRVAVEVELYFLGTRVLDLASMCRDHHHLPPTLPSHLAN